MSIKRWWRQQRAFRAMKVAPKASAKWHKAIDRMFSEMIELDLDETVSEENVPERDPKAVVFQASDGRMYCDPVAEILVDGNSPSPCVVTDDDREAMAMYE